MSQGTDPLAPLTALVAQLVTAVQAEIVVLQEIEAALANAPAGGLNQAELTALQTSVQGAITSLNNAAAAGTANLNPTPAPASSTTNPTETPAPATSTGTSSGE